MLVNHYNDESSTHPETRNFSHSFIFFPLLFLSPAPLAHTLHCD